MFAIFKLRRIAFIFGYAFLLPLLMKRIICVVINKVYISFFAIALDVCLKSPRLKVAKGNFFLIKNSFNKIAETPLADESSCMAHGDHSLVT